MSDRVVSCFNVPRLLLAAFLAFLAGCASQTAGPPAPTAAAPVGGYVGGIVPLECAPFARALSGMNLQGPAADWWEEAAGRYSRASTPAVGAVLIFRRTSRLPEGHAAVVSRLVSEREILVTQANWVPHRVTEDMPVVDVSAANDWSAVRVWWPPSGRLGGGRYPTWGFIVPDQPTSRERLAAATRAVIHLASSDGTMQ
jgi:surface antigen